MVGGGAGVAVTATLDLAVPPRPSVTVSVTTEAPATSGKSTGCGGHGLASVAALPAGADVRVQAWASWSPSDPGAERPVQGHNPVHRRDSRNPRPERLSPADHRSMDLSQITIPPSFVDLFVPPGRLRPSEPLAFIAERHELCEDMAQMLTETARARLFELGVTEDDVLQRIDQGLRAQGSPVSADEATWIGCRLAELLDWPLPPQLLDRLPAATLARMRRA
jgi:hypothetical protein